MKEEDSAESQKSKRYSAVKTRIFLLDIIVTTVLLIVFQSFLSVRLSLIIQQYNTNFYAACFVFASIFLLFMYIGGLPLHFISSFLVEHHFNLSRQSIGAWFIDEVKSTGLSFVLLIAGIELFYFVLRNFLTTWWIILAAVWIFFSIILTKFLPVFIIPLFYKYIPIEDSLLKQRILQLAERSNIQLMDVCQIDFSRKTSKANAALVGLGKTRKVVLSDTLIEKFDIGQIETVVAHEFGHFKYKHIWQLLAFSAFIITTGFFVLFKASDKIVVLTGGAELSDLHILPVFVFLMLVFSIVLLPVQNFFSRLLERQADKFTLTLTERAEDFISVMTKLAAVNLADVNPTRLKKIFLYDHPPIIERIHMAQNWERARDNACVK